MEQEHLKESFQYVESRIASIPKSAIILGSGLGSLADELTDSISIPCSEIPHYPKPRVAGHAGLWVVGKIDNTPIIGLKGRVHMYEGYSARTVTYPIRLLAKLGIQTLVVTNAAGGINTKFKPGDLMIIKDHINFLFDTPLIGDNSVKAEERFVDLYNAYDKEYVEKAIAVANSLKINIHTGVLMSSRGPTYETAAEIRMARTLGVDAGTMSTVPEVIAANQLKMRVLGVSCITNMATGILNQKLSHEEVTETANRIKDTFIRLMKEILKQIHAW